MRTQDLIKRSNHFDCWLLRVLIIVGACSAGMLQCEASQERGAQIDISSAAGIKWEFRPEGGTWQPIQVPAGGWRTQGYTCDAGTYRTTLLIPPEARGRVVRVAFSAVNFGAEVFAGADETRLIRVAEHVNGWMPFKADVTPLVKPGQRILLQVEVKGRKKFMVNGKYTVPQGADWFPGVADGILRGVAVEIIPALHVEDIWIRTRLKPDTLQARVTVKNAGARPVTATLDFALSSWNHQGFHYPRIPEIKVKLAPGESRIVDLSKVGWDLGPKSYWWPNIPYQPRYQAQLHLLKVAMKEDGKTIHEYQQRFGFRQFVARGNHYELNGIRCNLRGDNQQEANFGTDGYGVKAGFGAPTAVNPGWPQAVDNLLRLNFNVMRIHQIPATPYMLDVCDEKGLMLVDESPLRGSGGAEDFHAGRTNMLNIVRELVLRDRNHPAIVIWSAANEWAQPLRPAAETMLAVDDTRPIIGDGADFEIGRNTDANLDPVCIIMQHYVGGMPGLPLHGGTPRRDKPYGETEAVWPYDNTLAGFAWMGTGIRIRRLKGNADLRNYVLNNAWSNYVPGEGPESEILEKKVTKRWKGNLEIQPALTDPWNYSLIRLLQKCYHPLAVCDVDFDLLNSRSNTNGAWPTVKPCWVANTRVERKLAAFNDELWGEDVTVRWQLRQGTKQGPLLIKGEARLKIPPGEFRNVDIAFDCPATLGDVVLLLESYKDGKQRFVEDEIVFKILDRQAESPPDGRYRLLFLFNGKPTSIIFKEVPENDGAVVLTDESEKVRPHEDTRDKTPRPPLAGAKRSATVVNEDIGAKRSQLWTLKNLGGNDVILMNEAQGMALTVASQRDGVPAILAPYDSTNTSQMWHLEMVGDNCYRCVNKGSGKLLDVYGWYPLDSARLLQRPAMGAGYQLWKLEPVRQ